MTTVLAIDPGWERTGAAVVWEDGSCPCVEVLRFARPAKADGMRAWEEPARVRAILGETFWGAPTGWASIWRPSAVVIEIPPAVPPRRGRGFDQLPSRRLGELVGILGAIFDGEGMTVCRVGVSDWRTGVGVRVGASKDEIVAHASLRLRAVGQLAALERHRWAVGPDGGRGPRADAAEAYLIGCYGAAVLDIEARR